MGGSPLMDKPGTAAFHRMSRAEYNNTVRDLLGDSSAPANGFPADQDSAKSGFYAGGSVADADAAHLLEATEALAANAVKKLDTLLPCKPLPTGGAAEDACAQQFITQFGKRAFRRPLAADEAKSLSDLYAQQRMAGTDFTNSIRLVLSALLLSPQFLYRWEITPKAAIKEGAFVRYNSWEMASRLSYLFWASMPDDTAFGLAEQNKLSSPDQIEAEARRMLKDPKSKQAIADFFTQWLGVTELKSMPKDAKIFPSFTPELAASMIAESATFAANAVVDGDGKLNTIFTSNSSFIDANLAKLYGVANVTSPMLVPAQLNPAQRAGILTQASFLAYHASADETNPVKRGKLIADRVLCIETPLPPDDVPDPKMPSPNLSVRERFAEHSTNPCAAACHTVLDPLGFAFENYSGIGAWQTMDGGKPVDASGTIKLDGASKSFKNGIEFVGLIGQSKQVGDCMARQFLRYALRRKEGPGDEASLAAVQAAFAKGQNNLRELLVGLTRTHTFTHRTPSLGEVLQ
jgi:hypothetical protein